MGIGSCIFVLFQMSDTSGVSGLTHDIVDRAAAMTAKPNAIKDLVKTMGRLSNTFHDVESMLNEIDDLLKVGQNCISYSELSTP